MFLVVTPPPRLGARLLFCFSRRRRRRGGAACFWGGLGLGVGLPVRVGVDLRALRRGDAAIARGPPRVGLVEAAALEDDAHRVEDTGHRRPAFGALGQRRFGDPLLDLEMVTAAAAVSVNGHCRPNLYPDSRRQKTPARASPQLIQTLLFCLGSSVAGSLKSPGCSNPLCIISATRSKKASCGVAGSAAGGGPSAGGASTA